MPAPRLYAILCTVTYVKGELADTISLVNFHPVRSTVHARFLKDIGPLASQSTDPLSIYQNAGMASPSLH